MSDICSICGMPIAFGETECSRCGGDGIPGVGPNVPTVTNDKGGMQSHTPYGFHLLAPRAMFSMSAVMAEGAKKYAPDNWRKISIPEHLNHAMQHIFAYLAGDTQENHLAHAHCRIMMASELEECGEGEK